MPSAEPAASPAEPDLPATDPTVQDPSTGSGEPAAVDTVDLVDTARRRRLLTTLAALTVGVLVVDQLTKVWALASLEEGTRTALLGDLFGLQLIRNPGAALSIAEGMTWILTIVACVVVVVVVRASRRLGSLGWAIALGLLLGGALGNLVDRFFRAPGVARGHVIDFLAYGDWFIGNVADIAIVVAAGLVVVLAMRGVHLDGTREGAHDETDETNPTPDEAPDDAPADSDEQVEADGHEAPRA